jgi:hypothetical protein
MSYNRDGWAEVLCKVETAGPMYYIKWRWVGREMSYIRDGWAEGLCKAKMGGPRDCVKCRRVGRGTV